MENEAAAAETSSAQPQWPGEQSLKSGSPQNPDSKSELNAFNAVVSAIQGLPEEGRFRLIKSVLTFLGYSDSALGTTHRVSVLETARVREAASATSEFSEDRSISAKDFLFQKKPITDIERMACLAYYLQHYRNTPHFKTLDLSKLNTDAAQIKFANAAGAVENATSAGLLVQAGKGAKQLSALGELYVQNLPDREAAKEAIAHVKPRRKNRRQTENGENKK